MMPRAAIVSLPLLALLLAFAEPEAQTVETRQPVEAAPTTFGLLVGVGENTRLTDFRAPQRLMTHWIVVSSSGAKLSLTIPGLVVPDDEGFVHIVVRRQCEPFAPDPPRFDAEDQNCEDSIVKSPWDAIRSASAAPAKPAEASAKPAELEPPCDYEARSLTFASPTLLSVLSNSGRSGGCDDRGWQWTDSAEVLRLRDLTPVPFSELTGAAGKRAYALAAARAHRKWKREQREARFNDEGCEPDELRDTQWYVAHAAGRWIPTLQQQPGNGLCGMSASIDLTLPSATFGLREPSVPWKAVSSRFRRAVDAYFSPDRTVWLLEVGEDLVLTRASGGPPLITLPKPNDDVVMVQWAVGADVTKWNDALTRAASVR
jgi:hypothetical protein